MRAPEPRLLGVAGCPIGHSRSPVMHAAALRELGLAWRYFKLPLPPELFAETVRALPAVGYVGLNVTVPHKEAALEIADSRTPTAGAVGAANTLTFTEQGIEADNTDAPGLIAALDEPPGGRRALVLGAGGAGRAAAWALREAGAEVSVWNRTPERGRDLAAEFGIAYVERAAGAPDVVVNATSVGLDPDISEEQALEALGLRVREPPATLVDLVYGEHETALTAWARRGGSAVVDGLEVLVHQGALSLERWTGRGPPLAAMRAAAAHGGLDIR